MADRLMIDAHLDISMNALQYDRDQLLSIEEICARESFRSGPIWGKATVSLPELRNSRIGVILGTVLARAYPEIPAQRGPDVGDIGSRDVPEIVLRTNLDFANRTIACATALGMLAYYELLQEQGHLQLIRDTVELDSVWARHAGGDDTAPLGLILSMEGCDPIIEPEQADMWWQRGLRTACLAHYGPSAYAMGTGGDGPLTDRGRQVLREFGRLGMILDLVHTADTALAEALDIYAGPVFVSHGNCRALVDHDRQISDEQISRIAARGGILGIVLDAWMLKPNWRTTGRNCDDISMETVADHIDHVCQLTGSADHVGIGSDLDGGYGTEQCPGDLKTIADIQKLGPVLEKRGYSDDDVNAVFYGNWLRFFREALPNGESWVVSQGS